MQFQKDITPHMRAILVDWLIEVAEEYKLSSETLYLAVSYIDRYPFPPHRPFLPLISFRRSFYLFFDPSYLPVQEDGVTGKASAGWSGSNVISIVSNVL